MKASNFDHPLIFLLVITMGVVALMALGSWGARNLGWTGPLGLLKGGTA